MQRLLFRSHYSPSNLPMIFGEFAVTPMALLSLLVALLVVKLLSWLWEAALVSALTLLALSVSLLHGVVAIPSVAALVDGRRPVSAPVWRDRRASLAFSALWQEHSMI